MKMRSIAFSHLGTAALIVSFMSSLTHASPAKIGKIILPPSQKGIACGERPAFLSEGRIEIRGGLEALPKSVFVARDAEVWVEGQSEGKAVRVHAYQSFLKPRDKSPGKILCGETPFNYRERFAILAPTLIDFSKDKKVGHSFWQFQVVAQNQNFSLWNQKSAQSADKDSIEDFLKKGKTPYRLYQVGQNEYEVVIQRESTGVIQTLSVRYEALR